MPETTELTKEQIDWANALAKAVGVPGLPTSTPTPEPVSEPEGLEIDDEVQIDEYGIAYQNFDPRDAPGKLRDGALLTSTEWGAVGTELAGERKAFMDDYANKLIAIKAGGQTPMQKMAKCLPVLDAPENNPERGKVTALLGQLDALALEAAKPLPDTMSEQEKADKLKDFARQKGELLNTMHRELAEWVNRRTEQGQPPPREAVAMSDIVQAEHQKLIKEHIDKGWSPPPVAGMDQMTDEEQAKVKENWDKLVNGTGAIKFPTGRPTEPRDQLLYDHVVNSRTEGVPSEDELKEFRVEMLAAMARLMGTASGRDIIDQIQKVGAEKDKHFQFVPGNSPACVSNTVQARAQATANPENPEQDKRGVGSDVAVQYKLGGKDSYRSYNMDDGNFLFAPTPITLGHEMAHALHGMEGTNRANLPMDGLDPKWNNFEEYWTIHKGDLSEQTFREDYGLSAMRFGHISQKPKDEAANKSIKAVEDAKALADLRAGGGDKPAVDIEKVLEETRGFTKDDVAKMTDPIKLAIMQDDTAKGPLPPGWDPSRLDVAKIKAIVADKLPFKLTSLGWTSYNLPYSGGPVGAMDFAESIKEVTLAGVHSPRSGPGRQYKELGAKAAITAFGTFKTATGTGLGQWSDTDWRANLRTLTTANDRVNAMISGIPFVAADADPGRKVTVKDPLLTKLTRVAAIFANALAGKEPDKAGPLLADDALKHFAYTGEATADKQIEFLKGKSDGLKSSDDELAGGGLAVAGMTLVARDKAAKTLKDFKALPQFKTFQTYIKAANELADNPNTLEDAADQYAMVQNQLLTLDGWVAKSADTAVATAIRKLFIDDAVNELSRKPAFGDIVEKAMDRNDKAAAEMYQGNPSVEDILNNSRSSDAFSDWLEKTPEGKQLFGFYMAVYLRKTASITDAVQGDGLKSIGVKQDTVVRLRRDATDDAALAKAMAEVLALLGRKLPDFLLAMKAAA